MKIIIFTAVKNRCILHGRVFIMEFEGYSSGCMFDPQSSSIFSSIYCYPTIVYMYEKEISIHTVVMYGEAGNQ